MARPSLNLLVEWRQAIQQAQRAPTQTQARERLSVMPSRPEWESEDGVALLRTIFKWLRWKNDKPPAHLGVLDALDQAGAFPFAWSIVYRPLSHDQMLAPAILGAAPRASHWPPKAVMRWQAWATRGLSDTPSNEVSDRLIVNLLCDQKLSDLIEHGHDAVAQAGATHWPAVFTAPSPAGKVWLHKSTSERTVQWALAHGLDLGRPMGPEQRPLWWLAHQQGCSAVSPWVLTHDPAGAERYKIESYFKSLAAPIYNPEEKLLPLITRRPDWATVKDERGRPALWQACHHHLWLTQFGLRAALQHPGWESTQDDDGRNLAFAILASPDKNLSNDARGEALRYLSYENVMPELDRHGRGLIISWPSLAGLDNMTRHMAARPDPQLWWSGTAEQVDEALTGALATEQSPSIWQRWSDALKAVPPQHPTLLGVQAMLDAALGKSVEVAAEAAWPLVLDDTYVAHKALKNRPLLMTALRRAALAHQDISLDDPHRRVRIRHRT